VFLKVKIEEMIEKVVAKKINEIKTTSPSDIINNIEIVYDNKLVKDVPTKKYISQNQF